MQGLAAAFRPRLGGISKSNALVAALAAADLKPEGVAVRKGILDMVGSSVRALVAAPAAARVEPGSGSQTVVVPCGAAASRRKNVSDGGFGASTVPLCARKLCRTTQRRRLLAASAPYLGRDPRLRGVVSAAGRGLPVVSAPRLRANRERETSVAVGKAVATDSTIVWKKRRLLLARSRGLGAALVSRRVVTPATASLVAGRLSQGGWLPAASDQDFRTAAVEGDASDSTVLYTSAASRFRRAFAAGARS
mmetsp:Transcript_9568/g.25008  ORF Transcript_9568/g.25008 Transcript_9568/m.25008 type:complete len:250 (+) Transcript_9568:395-1144(+)